MIEVAGDNRRGSSGAASKFVRLMSATRFQEIEFEPGSGRLIATVGGRYTLAAGAYVETIEFRDPHEAPTADAKRYTVEREEESWRQRDPAGVTRSWRARRSDNR